jgi:hypothetical protein
LEEDQQKLAENQDFTSRFGAVTQQLGHEVAAVRLAGVVALAQLADEFEINRQMCIDGLCAYIRMPYDPKASSIKEGEKEVRLSIISEIVKRLQKDASPSWSEFNFDFSGATFDGGNFSGAQFSGGEVNFYEAQFSGGVVNFSEIIIEQPTTIDLHSAVGKIEVVMLPNPLPPNLTQLSQKSPIVLA